jgi:hypothetical protein
MAHIFAPVTRLDAYGIVTRIDFITIRTDREKKMKSKSLSFMIIMLLVFMFPLSQAGTFVQAEPDAGIILTVELMEYASCPFLFSWDGEGWQIENDLYPVGRGAEREYTDYLLLDNVVVPKDGHYCFEIREVPSEESWTDMLKLITIDHPADVSAGVDSLGNAHTYSNPASPLTAVDGSGNDVSTAVASKDNAGVDMHEGDVVVLDFTGVDIAAAAKLVVAVDGFEGEAEGNPTGKVPAIEIQTLEAGSWVTRDTFYPKEYLAEGVFDLQTYLGESQSVRLLSVSCDEGKYHVLDYVGLDNTLDELSSNLLEPVTAMLNGETDVLSDISNSDDVYVHTVNADTIVVCFTAAPLADEVRSFGFVSEGYYKRTGNSYYVDTWNGSSWVQRATLTSGVTMLDDAIKTADLRAFLPDPDGEYKVRIRNVISSSIGGEMAQVDWISLTIVGIERPIASAMEFDTTDIRSLVEASDDARWSAMNKWAVIKFSFNLFLPMVKK